MNTSPSTMKRKNILIPSSQELFITATGTLNTEFILCFIFNLKQSVQYIVRNDKSLKCITQFGNIALYIGSIMQ